MAPALLLFAFVSLYPLAYALLIGFFDRSLLLPGGEFVGLDNLIRVTQNQFIPFFRNTFVFTVGSTILSAGLGFSSALVMNRSFRGRSVFRALMLFPWVTPGVVVAFLWLWIYNANYGVLNGVLRVTGLIDENVHWLGSSTWAMVGVIVAKSWNSFPWMMVMFLAGLQSVPQDLLEAAQVDGASWLRRLWHVTIPELRGVIGVVLLLGAIWNFQHFEIIYVLTGGGPAGSTTTFAIGLYEMAFRSYDLGRAGALGLLWIASLSILAVAYFKWADVGDKP